MTRERTANLLGAWALTAADALREASEGAVGLGGAVPAALVTIDAYPGRSLEHLRRALDLSQPGAVRVVDRLERAGWVRRGSGPGRAISLTTTPLGRRVVRRLLAARRQALQELVAPLSDAETRALAPLLERLLAARTADRTTLERICRLCDRPACASCPVAGALR